jgi:hypothetical protein
MGERFIDPEAQSAWLALDAILVTFGLSLLQKPGTRPFGIGLIILGLMAGIATLSRPLSS